MRRPVTRVLLVVTVIGALAGGTVLSPSPASAYHTYDARLLDSTAYSLKRRQFRLGLFKLSYGVFDFFQVTTYTAPWILGAAFEDVAPNIEFRSTFFDHRKLALSASVGFITGTIEQVVNLRESRLRYYMTPVSIAASVRYNWRFSSHFGGTYTATQGDANAGLGFQDLGGSAVIDLFQLWAMFEGRLSKVVAFTFTVRWVPWVSDTIVRGEISGNPGGDIQLEVELIDLKNAFAFIPGFVFSWRRANIRLGVGYGDVFGNFLGIPLAVPRELLKGVSPEFDVFVRF
jgi:hypothetical protein